MTKRACGVHTLSITCTSGPNTGASMKYSRLICSICGGIDACCRLLEADPTTGHLCRPKHPHHVHQHPTVQPHPMKGAATDWSDSAMFDLGETNTRRRRVTCFDRSAHKLCQLASIQLAWRSGVSNQHQQVRMEGTQATSALISTLLSWCTDCLPDHYKRCFNSVRTTSSKS